MTHPVVVLQQAAQLLDVRPQPPLLQRCVHNHLRAGEGRAGEGGGVSLRLVLPCDSRACDTVVLLLAVRPNPACSCPGAVNRVRGKSGACTGRWSLFPALCPSPAAATLNALLLSRQCSLPPTPPRPRRPQHLTSGMLKPSWSRYLASRIRRSSAGAKLMTMRSAGGGSLGLWARCTEGDRERNMGAAWTRIGAIL